MNTLTFSQRALLERVAETYPNKEEFRKPELKIIADQVGISHKDVDKIFNLGQKVRYGVYNLQAVILPFQNKQPQINTKESPKVQNVQSVMNDEIFYQSKIRISYVGVILVTLKLSLLVTYSIQSMSLVFQVMVKL